MADFCALPCSSMGNCMNMRLVKVRFNSDKRQAQTKVAFSGVLGNLDCQHDETHTKKDEKAL